MNKFLDTLAVCVSMVLIFGPVMFVSVALIVEYGWAAVGCLSGCLVFCWSLYRAGAWADRTWYE